MPCQKHIISCVKVCAVDLPCPRTLCAIPRYNSGMSSARLVSLYNPSVINSRSRCKTDWSSRSKSLLLAPRREGLLHLLLDNILKANFGNVRGEPALGPFKNYTPGGKWVLGLSTFSAIQGQNELNIFKGKGRMVLG